jgi:hypothetical protein
MKFSTKCIIATLALAGFNSQASAFTAPKAGRVATNLDVTSLEEWQLLDNGSVVGSVRGHPSLSDGDIITTSPLTAPGSAMTEGVVRTLTGSEYKLGAPMQLKRPNTPAGVDDPAMGRSSFITSVGLGGLFAGGIAVGFGISNSGEKPMSVPEVCIEVETFISVFVMSIFLNNFPFFQTGQDWHGFSRVS